MEQAAENGQSATYDRILNSLKDAAQRNGCGAWVDQHLQQIEARIHAGSATT
jgi:hypothetical protein